MNATSSDCILDRWRLFRLGQQLAFCGKAVRIDRTVRVEQSEKVYLDNFCTLYQGAILVGKSRASNGTTPGAGSAVREHACLNTYSGFFITGPNVYIEQF
jgi:hypothetical protein